MSEPSPSRDAERAGPAGPLSPARVVPSVVSGAVVGVVQVALAVSYAALVFSGELAPFVGRGVGFALFGAAAAGLVVALLASVPGTVGNAKGVTAVLLATIAAGVVDGMPAGATDEARFASVVAALAIAAFGSGFFLLVLGRFRLGRLVRFLPYPVIGGFIAGTGWLLAQSSMELLAGTPLWFGNLGAWLEPGALTQWGLGLAVALGLLLVTLRSDWPLSVPIAIVGLLAGFGAWSGLSGTSTADLAAAGWLLGPLPEGGLWRPTSVGPLGLVHWPAVAGQAPAMAIVAVIAAMEVLLNASGLEVEIGTDVDLERELRTAGLASIAAGAGGGFVGYQVLSLTVLGARLGGANRLAAAFACTLALACMVVGAAILAALPVFVLGGLMAYTGLRLVYTWVVGSWRDLPRLEYALVIAILVSIAAAGILVGVLMGILASILLFAVAYGRVDVVRHERTAAQGGSRVAWSTDELGVLGARADSILILQLQGYLFFGTAHRLVRHVERVLTRMDGASPETLVLDFRRVTGVDATAAFNLRKVAQATAERNIDLVLTDVHSDLEPRLRSARVTSTDHVHVFPDLDRGLEWCERRLLRASGQALASEHAGRGPLAGLEVPVERRPALEAAFARRELDRGDVLVAQGDPADTLYVVASGSLTAQLEQAGAEPLRLETVGPGAVLGELGFFLDQPRTASVVADDASVVYALERRALEQLQREDPATALALHAAMTRRLSERVRHLMGVVRALER